jgi:hypothetical protein
VAVGCESTPQGQKDAENVRSQVESFGKVAESAEIELRTALTALGQMVDSEGGDLKKPYKDFSSSVGKCEKQVADLKTRVDKMDIAAASYFQTWETNLETISSESLRAQSKKQLEEARGHYHALNQHANGVVKAFEPILATLKDQVQFLGNQLNASSVKSLKANADEVKKQAEDFYKRIAEIRSDVRKYMDATATTIEPDKPAEGDAKG